MNNIFINFKKVNKFIAHPKDFHTCHRRHVDQFLTCLLWTFQPLFFAFQMCYENGSSLPLDKHMLWTLQSCQLCLVSVLGANWLYSCCSHTYTIHISCHKLCKYSMILVTLLDVFRFPVQM